MGQPTIVYLHGFASSSRGTKGDFFRQQCDRVHARYLAPDFTPTPRDFEYMTVTGMIGRLRQFLWERQVADVGFIGSSLGGLVALHYGHRYPGVSRLLLLAPALTYLFRGREPKVNAAWRATGTVDTYHFAFGRPLPLRYAIQEDGAHYQEPPAPPVPITIIHGRHDEVVPIGASRDYAARFPKRVRLVEIEAGHDINDHLDLVWREVEAFLLS